MLYISEVVSDKFLLSYIFEFWKIIEGLFKSPVVLITHVVKEFSVSYPTAKSDLEKLVEIEILQELPETRPKAYYAPQVLKAAYNDTNH